MDGELTQLSAVISEPGSPQQTRHCDTEMVERRGDCLYTLLVALQDITLDMGPTMLWGGTHTAKFHALNSEENAKYGPNP